jgi:hypothetical protein
MEAAVPKQTVDTSQGMYCTTKGENERECENGERD